MADESTNKLFSNVIKNQWDEVEEIYKKYHGPQVTGEKLRPSESTALLMAVYRGDEQYVDFQMRNMEGGDLNPKDLADDKGNTLLHLAAKLGNQTMCTSIAEKLPELIGFRNNDGETPLFFAALHGKNRAFVVLCIICIWNGNVEQIYGYGRRNRDGRTVLHCAIDGQYFELAYEIIQRYPNFLHSVDEQGYFPLHLLASKHSAFRSSTRLTWLQKLIYPCIILEKPRRTDDSKDVDDDADRYLLSELDAYYEWRLRYDVENPPPRPTTYPPLFHSTARTISSKMAGWLNQGVIRRASGLFPKHIVKMKEKHVWANFMKDELLRRASDYAYLQTGYKPISGNKGEFWNQGGPQRESPSNTLLLPAQKDAPTPTSRSGSVDTTRSSSHNGNIRGIASARLLLNKVSESLLSLESSTQKNKTIKESPLLVAAKNGISEIVEGILERFPEAMHDVSSEGKNLMLLAVENRQSHIYQHLLLPNGKYFSKDLLNSVDNDGNNALHLVAMFNPYRFWMVPNAVLQMQWETKWYECIKENVPGHLLAQRNNEGKTPNEIFLESHSELLQNDKEWLMKTSEQCSIVATLIATVAFATSSSVPGDFTGVGNNGKPLFRELGAFKLFAIPSIVALCTSLTAVAIFLSILTSRHQAADFRLYLPLKLMFGLTALFAAVISMLISFSSGHFFIIKDIVRHATLIEFIGAFLLPVTCFVLMLFPLYRNVWLAIVKKVPQRGYMVTA